MRLKIARAAGHFGGKMPLMDSGGAYPAERAAALSGVPLSTVHYWARKELLVPSVSATRTKLWSYADLLELRAIDWLRKDKEGYVHGADIPRSRMPEIRAAKEKLRLEFDVRIFHEGVVMVAVSRAGEVIIAEPGTVPYDSSGQVLTDYVDLIKPDPRKIHLLSPRPLVRIVPGKLSGAPHILATRVETQALHSLKLSGYDRESILALYPYLTRAAVRDALDLEDEITGLAKAA